MNAEPHDLPVEINADRPGGQRYLTHPVLDISVPIPVQFLRSGSPEHVDRLTQIGSGNEDVEIIETPQLGPGHKRGDHRSLEGRPSQARPVERRRDPGQKRHRTKTPDPIGGHPFDQISRYVDPLGLEHVDQHRGEPMVSRLPDKAIDEPGLERCHDGPLIDGKPRRRER